MADKDTTPQNDSPPEDGAPKPANDGSNEASAVEAKGASPQVEDPAVSRDKSKTGSVPQLADGNTESDENDDEQVKGKSKLKKVAVLTTVAMVVVSGVAWFLLGDEEQPPHERLAQALTLLEDESDVNGRQDARDIAHKLRKMDFRDPDFAGGTEFVLGIAAFRDANGLDESSAEPKYLEAVNYLRESERRALDEPHRPEWRYALGMSLHRIGASTDALPHLKEAVETYPKHRVEVSMVLADIYLDLQTESGLENAIQANDVVLDDPKVEQQDRDRAYLQRAQILLAMGRKQEAEDALKSVSDASAGNLGTKVFQAQTLMAEGNYPRALQILDSVAKETGLEDTYPRQASYLMGVCAERMSDTEAAINYYKRTVTEFGKSHEQFAANFSLADLYRMAQRDEEAVAGYRSLLRTITSPREFRNRWVSRDDLVKRILGAWNDWSDRHEYQSAISLAERMHPLFSEIEAQQLISRANQRWAENLEAKQQAATYVDQLAMDLKVRDRWRQSAAAYSRLAELLSTTSQYLPTLWTSAEQYFFARDFPNAVAKLTVYLDADPKERVPQSLVFRGQAQLNLGEMDLAISDFRKVTNDYATDIANFRARLLLGSAYLEKAELSLAEEAWRSLLSSQTLRPEALEWRKAKFELGRLLYYQARNTLKRLANDPLQVADAGNADGVARQKEELAAYEILNEAMVQLGEFVERFPNDEDAPESRYKIASGMRLYAELPFKRYQTAETENARIEQRQAMTDLLNSAVEHLRFLQQDLFHLNEDGRLGDVGQMLLQSSYFDIAETHYLLARVVPSRYRDSITAYSQAINKYPQTPRVLAAYLRMKTSHDRLGQPAESRIVIKQARVILDRIPEDAFTPETSAFTKQEWTDWLDVIQKFHNSSTLAANKP